MHSCFALSRPDFALYLGDVDAVRSQQMPSGQEIEEEGVIAAQVSDEDRRVEQLETQPCPPS
jgi:hypothetical protein